MARVVKNAGTAQRATSTANPRSMEKDASDILMDLQESLRVVIGALPETFPRAADLERLLKLDKKLAWQVFRFAETSAVFAASAHLPGLNAMSRFLAAAEKKGASTAMTARVAEALNRLEKFIVARVGNRSTYNSIVAGDSDDQSLTLQQRKASFRATAHLLGAQTDVQTMTFALHPSVSEPGHWDLLALNHRKDVQRLRSSARIVWKARLDVGREGSRFEPIEPMPNEDAFAGVIRKYCSNYSVETIQVKRSPLLMELELASGSLGSAAATTWTFGVVERNTREGINADHPWNLHVNIAGAQRVLIIDVMLHDSVSVEPTARADTYVGFVNSPPGRPIRTDMSRIDVREHVEATGRGLSAMRSSDAPQYVELMEHVCERLGWKPSEFRTYRCRVEYPIFGSSIELTLRG